MPLKSEIFSASGAVTTTDIVIRKLEVTPDGGSLEVRILTGTDSDGTERYRIRANETSEFRDFGEGIAISGPIYAYFYEGDGSITVIT